tara:strand:- start:356 stop:943 length:588 start_codon:yes stop_codon:yes gene_type:complete
MQAVSIFEPTHQTKWFDADRIGVIASILCAIHCAVTPFLLLLLPTFGKIWAHPATHWGMALLVVPIAVAMMTAGYRKHRRKWILTAGTMGVAFVVLGAAVPYLENSTTQETGGTNSSPAASDAETAGSDTENHHEESCAVDACCPTLMTDAAGKTKLKVPAASIVTTLGGIFLVVTHLGNLCTCASCCRKKESAC